MEGSPPQYLLNPFASIRSSRRWRVETKRIICLFKLLRRLGTVSFGAAMMGHIHQGWLLGGIPIWEAFLGGLFLGITKVLDPYK